MTIQNLIGIKEKTNMTEIRNKKIKEMIKGKIVSYNGKNYKLKVVDGDMDSIYVQVIPENINESINREIVIGVSSIKFDEINATLEKPIKHTFEIYDKRFKVKMED